AVVVPAVALLRQELEVDDPADCRIVLDLAAAAVARGLFPLHELPDRSHRGEIVSGRAARVGVVELAPEAPLLARAIVSCGVAVAFLGLARQRDPGARRLLRTLLHAGPLSDRAGALRWKTKRAPVATTAMPAPSRNAAREPYAFQIRPKMSEAGKAARPTEA